jgi:YD repeat-containing protein
MKSQLLLGCLGTILLFSCKKEKENEEENNASAGTKLTKIASIAGSLTTTTFFTYDADGKLATWRRTESGGGTPSNDGFRIQRKAGGMIDRVIFKRTGFSDSVSLVVSSSGTQYTSAELTEIAFGSTETRRTAFTYDNAGNIAEATTTDIHGNGQTDPKSRINYTYANGNVTSAKVYRISGGTNDLFVQYDLTYDQKPNPLAYGAEWILLTSTEMLFGAHGSANNFTRIAVKQSGAPERPFTVTYTYNEKGLPATAVQKEETSGQVVSTSTYTYQ